MEKNRRWSLERFSQIWLSIKYETWIFNHLSIHLATHWKPKIGIWWYLLFFSLTLAIENLTKHLIFDFIFLISLLAKLCQWKKCWLQLFEYQNCLDNLRTIQHLPVMDLVTSLSKHSIWIVKELETIHSSQQSSSQLPDITRPHENWDAYF
jgi:hypothetical protein